MEDDQSALEPLLELFVYAPIGMIYEYPDVLPNLVKRGKSQVQLAKLMGQMAKGADGSATVNVEDLVSFASQLLNKVVGDVGEFVASQVSHQAAPVAASEAASEPVAEPKVAATVENTVPFAGYDDLNAKSIVAQLSELTRIQLIHVKRYEQVHKTRKTVLSAVERLCR